MNSNGEKGFGAIGTRKGNACLTIVRVCIRLGSG